MALTTSSLPLSRRREQPAAAARLLTIGGHIRVVANAPSAVGGMAVAAVAVFGGAVLDAL